MEQRFTHLSHAVEGAPLLALGASVIWSILSVILSPCHLANPVNYDKPENAHFLKTSAARAEALNRIGFRDEWQVAKVYSFKMLTAWVASLTSGFGNSPR